MSEKASYFRCFLWGTSYQYIIFTDIKSFFNLDNLEPASGRPNPELEVKALKIGKLQAPGCQIKKYLVYIWYICIYNVPENKSLTFSESYHF